jgi:hypothetical protein
VHLGIADGKKDLIEIHARILEGDVLPDYVFLETGTSPKRPQGKNMAVLGFISGLYTGNNYSVIEECKYILARGWGYRFRRYVFLELNNDIK